MKKEDMKNILIEASKDAFICGIGSQLTCTKKGKQLLQNYLEKIKTKII